MIGGYDLNYGKFIGLWEKINDFVEGVNTIKTNALVKNYIVLPSGIESNSNEADRYIERGFIPELVSLALSEANGRVFQKELRFPEGLEELKDFKNNVDGANVSLEEMAGKIVNNLNSKTRCGLLVDWWGKQPKYKNQKEREESSDRAVMKFYDSEEIVDVVTNNKGKIIKIELAEKYCEDMAETYKIDGEYKYIEARRVLFINDSGVYEHRLYVEPNDPNKKDKWELKSQTIPLARGEVFREIPFVIFNGKTNNHEVYKPRLLDMVEVMIAIFRNWTELEHILHGVCMPVRTASGISEEESKTFKKIGPTSLWWSVNENAKFQMLEISGDSIDKVIKNIENKLKVAEREGYVFLTDVTNKTATQTRIETTGRVLTLGDVVKSTNSGMTKALELVFKFYGIPFNPEKNDIELSIKQDDFQFDSSNFKELVNATHVNLMRMKDLHKFMVENKITDEQDFIKWKTEIENQIEEYVPMIRE